MATPSFCLRSYRAACGNLACKPRTPCPPGFSEGYVPFKELLYSLPTLCKATRVARLHHSEGAKVVGWGMCRRLQDLLGARLAVSHQWLDSSNAPGRLTAVLLFGADGDGRAA